MNRKPPTIPQLQAELEAAQAAYNEVMMRDPPSPEWMMEEVEDRYDRAEHALAQAEMFENDPF